MIDSAVHRLATPIIEPLLDAVEPTVVVETGAGAGRLTRRVLERLRDGATLHAIDPELRFDPQVLAAGLQASVIAHAARSLDVIGMLEPSDLVLLDGDPNWYTVRQELALLASVARRAGRDRPVVVVHHTDWPFGRRDGFYDLDAVPEDARPQCAAAGVVPGTEAPAPNGLRLVPHVALAEGLPRSGVLTAIEDFLLEQEDRWRTVELPGLQGVAVLVPPERLARGGALGSVLDLLSDRKVLLRQISRVEREWVRALLSVRPATAQPRPEPIAAEPAPPAVQPVPVAAEAEPDLVDAIPQPTAPDPPALPVLELVARLEREKYELASRLESEARSERETLLHASIEAGVRLEAANRELEAALRAAEQQRQLNADLERRSVELDERLRDAGARAAEQADQVRVANARAAHYAEQLESSRAQGENAERRVAALEAAHAELVQQGRAAAEQLDRATATLRFRIARRLGRAARKVTFRGEAPPHPVEEARTGLRRELMQATAAEPPTPEVSASDAVRR